MFRTTILLGTAFCLLLPAGSEARTVKHPIRGAVKKPGSFRIRHPFPCGVALHVNCGYGPRCSPAHKRVNAEHSTNDYYALDLIRSEPGNGFDKSVVAVAGGVVRYAGWTRRGWSPYGMAVYIEHSFRDSEGHSYQTLYAHLNRVKVRAGQRVRSGEIIGTLGGSSRRNRGRYGPHLHFAMYQDAGSTLGGGRAVLPEPLGHFTGVRSGMDMIACGRPEPTRVAVSSALFDPTAVGGLPGE